MEPTRLNPGQVAQLLGISTRTLRRWSTAFSNSLSAGARRRGRKRSFDGQDVATLRQASELLDDGLTLAQIAERLPAIEPNQPVTALTLSTEASMALGQALERTARLTDDVSDLDVRVDQLERWLALPWWRRIFTRPGSS